MHHPRGDGEVAALMVGVSCHSAVGNLTGVEQGSFSLQRLKAVMPPCCSAAPAPSKELAQYQPAATCALHSLLNQMFLADHVFRLVVSTMDLTAQPLVLFLHSDLTATVQAYASGSLSAAGRLCKLRHRS